MNMTILVTRTSIGNTAFDNLIYALGFDYPVDQRTEGMRLTVNTVELIEAT